MFELRLDEDIFEIVKNGSKRVEVRLYDDKRKNMNIGDILTFYKRPLLKEMIKTRIVNINKFESINDLLDKYEMKDIYVDGVKKEDFKELLLRFYSKEEQEKYGFVAIEFEVV